MLQECQFAPASPPGPLVGETGRQKISAAAKDGTKGAGDEPRRSVQPKHAALMEHFLTVFTAEESLQSADAGDSDGSNRARLWRSGACVDAFSMVTTIVFAQSSTFD